ncbi:YlzJ-like family protein [Caldibacillus lycopersici]|uniref:YlzJ-like family protein n=1 Tax=Perspicuibacillus lycopersici TaxID=1325689 RepID=A0AAE3IPY1_9BACI|nr:YlzJ-like family protein [Perspicuibacillus lycopersici]MCU9612047.1 YlzJ-like family protein [Perspicuibacillus lycopersici]
MILYTIIPQELIFETEQKALENKERFVHYQGIPVAIEPVNGNEVRVTKILSTDPTHYLNSNCFPGAVLSIWDGHFS